MTNMSLLTQLAHPIDHASPRAKYHAKKTDCDHLTIRSTSRGVFCDDCGERIDHDA